MKPSRFHGSISLDEVFRGAGLTGENAHRLFDDAKTVLKQGSSQTALALAIVGLEEEAKCASLVLMADLIERGETPDWDAFWRGFYNHGAKHLLGLHVNVAASDSRDEDAINIYGLLADVGLEGWRQASLYIDRNERGWIPPVAEEKDVVVAIIAAGMLHLPVLLWLARQETVAFLKGEKGRDMTKEELAMHNKAVTLLKDIQLAGHQNENPRPSRKHSAP